MAEGIFDIFQPSFLESKRQNKLNFFMEFLLNKNPNHLQKRGNTIVEKNNFSSVFWKNDS